MSARRKALFAALTTTAALLLIEVGSAALERSLLRRTLPSPSPHAPRLDTHDSAPVSPAQSARWGARPDGAPSLPAVEIPPGAHLNLARDDRRGWGLTPNQLGVSNGIPVRINHLGLRGPPPPAPDSDTVRLMTTGDSSVYGDTVAEEDVFSRIAAARLSARWGCTVAEVNGGVPGYTSVQALHLLRERWPDLAPQIVVIASMWSDIYPSRRRPRAEAPLQGPLRRLSTYRMLRLLLSPWLSAQKVRWIDGQEDLVSDDADATVPLPQYIATLRETAAFVQQQGSAAVFLALPAPIDLDRAPVPEIMLEYRAAMALVAEQTGSLLVDGPAWMAREGGSLALFNDNVHPSAAGHALIGYALAETLADRPACP